MRGPHAIIKGTQIGEKDFGPFSEDSVVQHVRIDSSGAGVVGIVRDSNDPSDFL